MQYNILKSRTFWTFVAMFVIGGGNEIVPLLPPTYAALAMAALMGLGQYFHIDGIKSAAAGSIKS